MTPEPGHSRQSSIRFVFRVTSVVVLTLAAYLLVVGPADFSSADEDGSTSLGHLTRNDHTGWYCDTSGKPLA